MSRGATAAPLGLGFFGHDTRGLRPRLQSHAPSGRNATLATAPCPFGAGARCLGGGKPAAPGMAGRSYPEWKGGAAGGGSAAPPRTAKPTLSGVAGRRHRDWKGGAAGRVAPKGRGYVAGGGNPRSPSVRSMCSPSGATVCPVVQRVKSGRDFRRGDVRGMRSTPRTRAPWGGNATPEGRRRRRAGLTGVPRRCRIRWKNTANRFDD
jgi:hypothetical protein